MKIRRSGILLHITSLPAPYGIGDLGPEAYRFADALAAAGQGLWQVLPLNPVSPACGNSPYCSVSAFAGNPLLISPELLVEEGLLEPSELAEAPHFEEQRVDYEAVAAYKYHLFRSAAEKFIRNGRQGYEFERFCEENSYWLEDHALFVSLKEYHQGRPWVEWAVELRDREPVGLAEWKNRLSDRMFFEQLLQYLFFKQWLALKSYCNCLDIQIIGDMPIYVSYDSFDVWSNPWIFKLDEAKKPLLVAGVPPDYFSATGQLWGNPVYNWNFLQDTHYAWWVQRLGHNLELFDILRLDHFRGFIGYWEVPGAEQTAVNGRWAEAPAKELFDTFLQRFPYLPVIAEDLGTITPDVKEVLAAYAFPGMKVLLFAFGDDLAKNPYVPHNLVRNSVVYTGTHDNNTIRGWFNREAKPQDKARLFQYLGHTVGEDQIHWALIRLALMSVANTAMIPFQDVLGLGEEARMNQPAVAQGNWEWRLTRAQMASPALESLSEMTRIFGRA